MVFRGNLDVLLLFLFFFGVLNGIKMFCWEVNWIRFLNIDFFLFGFRFKV